MPDYASNSKKSKKADAPEEKKIEPVVSSPVSAKKRPYSEVCHLRQGNRQGR